MVVAVKYRRYR